MKIDFPRLSATALVLLLAAGTSAQVEPELTVKEIMNSLITPMTSTIWGAYELETDAEWQEVRNAALGVIAAGNILTFGGADANFQQSAEEQAWQEHNQAMISAARSVLEAVAAKDEDALFAAGNDQLYPPCESCHQQYQTR